MMDNLKFNYRYLLLLLSLVVLLFNNYELTFAVWFLVVVLTVQIKYSFHFVKIISCFALILGISFLTDFFFYENTFYNKARDFAYLMKPILGLLIGYNISKSFKEKSLNFLVDTGIFIAFIHLVLVAIAILKYSTLSVAKIREHCGYFNDYEPYIIILLIFYDKFTIEISRKRRIIYLGILVLSTFFYLSRTNFIQIGILYLGVMGYYRITPKSIKIFSITIVSLVVGYIAIFNYNPRRNAKGLDEFLYKIKIIPIEAFKTKIDKDDWKDFNDNFRSFENIKTVKQIFHGGTQPIVSGNGLGSTLDIGRKMWTNDGTYVRYYPVLHNAFSTVLLKTGLLGILIYVMSIILIGKTFKGSGLELEYLNRIMLSSAFFMVISSWVFMGFYLKLDNKSILLGILLGYREFLIKKQNLKTIDSV